MDQVEFMRQDGGAKYKAKWQASRLSCKESQTRLADGHLHAASQGPLGSELGADLCSTS